MNKYILTALCIFGLLWFSNPSVSDAKDTFIANSEFPKFDLCSKDYLLFSRFMIKNRTFYTPNRLKYNCVGGIDDDSSEFNAPCAPEELIKAIRELNKGKPQSNSFSQKLPETEISEFHHEGVYLVGFGILGKVFTFSPTEYYKGFFEDEIEFSECTKIEK
jgi:hypothetical protein